MPHQAPSPVSDEAFQGLLNYLHPSPPELQELAILPSSLSPPNIQYDPNPPALAIPKLLLLSCFLRARDIFSCGRYVSVDAQTEASEHARGSSLIETFQATSVILLWEPNHQTAANWRKRYFLHLLSGAPYGKLENALRAEWSFLASLLTSPLPPHHAKSPTLWFHRFWLFKMSRLNRFPSSHVSFINNANVIPEKYDNNSVSGQIWKEELQVVMQAGERHPRNYYAWTYARKLWNALFLNAESKETVKEDLVKGQARPGLANAIINTQSENDSLLPESIREVHKWCFQHPRDISGWSFLHFLLQNYASLPRLTMEIPLGEESSEIQDVLREVYQRTLHFSKEYIEKSESVEWFLNAIGNSRSAKPLISDH